MPQGFATKNHSIKSRLIKRRVVMKDIKNLMPVFKGIFSSTTLDYRELRGHKEPLELEANVIGGYLRILVPKDWHVEVKGKLIFAMMDNYTKTYEENSAHLRIKIKALGAMVLIINESYK